MFLQSIILTIVASQTIQTVELGNLSFLFSSWDGDWAQKTEIDPSFVFLGRYKSCSTYTTEDLHVTSELINHQYPTLLVPDSFKGSLIDGIIFGKSDESRDFDIFNFLIS